MCFVCSNEESYKSEVVLIFNISVGPDSVSRIGLNYFSLAFTVYSRLFYAVCAVHYIQKVI